MSRRRLVALWSLAGALAWLSIGVPAACNIDLTFPGALPGADAVVDAWAEGVSDAPLDVTGKGVGEPCSGDGDCRRGLACRSGRCAPLGETAEGQACLLSAECAAGLHCATSGACSPAGRGAVGAVCASGADCEPGAVCLAGGFVGTCVAAGAGDVGAACEARADCLAGLRCAADGTCQAGSARFGAPVFAGADCAAADEETGPPRPYFEVARPSRPSRDFYRLPFPNDARLVDGRVDLSGHPRPLAEADGEGVVARLLDALEADATGWSTNPTLFFRFSTWIDTASVVAGGEGKTVRMVDLTEGSADWGQELDLGWYASTGRDKYLCGNSLRLHRPWSRPLKPGAIYGVVLLSGLRAATTKDADGAERPGVPLVRDADFDAVLGSARPSDATLGRVWEAYAPLRAWIASGAVDGAEVVGGTVFTTARVRDGLPRLRAAVDARPAPAFSAWTTCGQGATSPCDDGLAGAAHARGCFDASTDFYELHARVALPVFQEGERPYLTPGGGGGVRFDGDAARVVGEESVCVALTIPKGLDAPPAGWPVVLYAHGTGSSFRGHVSEGLADWLTRVDDAGPPQGLAVVGWDQVMHGPRRHSDFPPEVLMYGSANPRATLGNLWQAASDELAMVRALRAAVVPAEASPTGAEIRFDVAHLYFLGHSQGGGGGSLALPWEPDVPVAIYGGTGGGLALSLVGRSAPVPFVEGVKAALHEPQVGATHPVLALLQAYLDPVDPLNYAALQFAFPEPGLTRRHVLYLYGQGDRSAPPDGLAALASAMYTTLAEPVLDDIGGVATAPPPIQGNWAGTTGVTAQYAPAGYDGHLVLFEHAKARRQVRAFLSTALGDGAPTLVP